MAQRCSRQANARSGSACAVARNRLPQSLAALGFFQRFFTQTGVGMVKLLGQRTPSYVCCRSQPSLPTARTKKGSAGSPCRPMAHAELEETTALRWQRCKNTLGETAAHHVRWRKTRLAGLSNLPPRFFPTCVSSHPQPSPLHPFPLLPCFHRLHFALRLWKPVGCWPKAGCSFSSSMKPVRPDSRSVPA